MLLRIRLKECGARFIHPMDPPPRTAILAPGFQQSKLVRVFPTGWTVDAVRFEPASVAGPMEQIRRLLRIQPQLTHSIIVFTYEGEAPLCDEDRDALWSVFGVPVFEQQLGPANQLLAMECDAHAGMHLAGNFRHLQLDKNACACGNPAPRLPRRPRVEELADLLA